MIIPASQNDYAAGFADGYRQGKKDIERKKGKWIPHEDEEGWNCGFNCSECGEWFVIKPEKPKFCPNCGADMRGGEDG